MDLDMAHANRNRPTPTDVDIVPIVGYCETTMGSRVVGYAALTMENGTPQDIEGPPTPNKVKALVAKLRRLQVPCQCGYTGTLDMVRAIDFTPARGQEDIMPPR